MTPRTLTGISSRTWEHPCERGALAALGGLEGYDDLREAVLSPTPTPGATPTLNPISNPGATPTAPEEERRACQEGGVRVGPRQLGRVHELFAETARALDVAGVPELYVVPGAGLDAVTLGVAAPFVRVDRGLVDLLDDDELRFVLAGQLGQAISGHAPYLTLRRRLGRLRPLLGARGLTVLTALDTWAGVADLSADRAALLATQDPTVALATLLRLVTGGHLAALDLDELHAQLEPGPPGPAEPGRSRPVTRARELTAWIESGDYEQVLAGGYPRREAEAEADAGGAVGEEVRSAAAAYAESFADTRARLEAVAQASAGGAARKWFGETFRGRR